MAQRLKCLPAMWETWVWSLGQEDPLEKEMATYSSILAWRILWTEEPGGLQSTGSQRVGHDWATSLTHMSIKFFFEKERWYYSWQLNNLGVAAGNWSLWAVENLHITYGQPFISVIPLYPWIQPTSDLFTVGKKSRYKWTHTVQTPVV